MPVFLGLLAATAFAAGTVLQQRGVLRAPASADDPRFLGQILRERVWLAGALLQATGWVLQAAALDRGPLLVIQSLTTLSIVIALPLGVVLTDQQVGRREVGAAAAVVVGIIVFLAFGAPSAGTSSAAAVDWWVAAVLCVFLVGAAAARGRSRHGPMRAALFGTAAGIGFAMQAAVTKVFVDVIGDGIAALLVTWSTYALILTALAGFVLQQSALKTGALAAAMASSNASTLLFSAVFGAMVFDERLTRSPVPLALACCGLALAVAGVVRLAATTSSARSSA